MVAEVARGGDIKVTPSALGDAAGVASAVAASVRESSTGVPGGGLARFVGDAGCAEALTRAGRLLQQTVTSASAGVDELARALSAARGTYRLADDLAVPGAGG